MSRLTEVEEPAVKEVEETTISPEPEETPEEVSRRRKPRPSRRGGQMRAVRRQARGYFSR